MSYNYIHTDISHSVFLTTEGTIMLSTNKADLEIRFIPPHELAGLKDGYVLVIYRPVNGSRVCMEFAHVISDAESEMPSSLEFKAWLNLPPDCVLVPVMLGEGKSNGGDIRLNSRDVDIVDFVRGAVALSRDKLMMEMYPIKYVCNHESRAIAKSIANQHVLIDIPSTKLIVDVSIGDVSSPISQFAIATLGTITPLIPGVPIMRNGFLNVDYYQDLIRRGIEELHPVNGRFKEWFKHVTII